jgi:hypothetical protein
MPKIFPEFFFDSPKKQNIAVIPFLLFFLIISVASIRGKYTTTDEPNHYRYGMHILNGDSSRYEDGDMSKMPFSAWNALPAKIASFLPDGKIKDYLEKEIIARSMTILFSLVVAAMIFHWARELYGFTAALASLTLYVLDPNIIAHSQLVTTDIYSAGVLLFSTYFLWRFAKSRRWQDGLWFALMLGLAQIAKYTSISLYPVLAIAMLVSDLPVLFDTFKAKGKSVIPAELMRYIKYGLITAGVGILMINIGFLFNRTFTMLKDYKFRTESFKSLQTKINFPVPTPYPYLDGFEWIIFDERTNYEYGNLYLLGEVHDVEGFNGYYIVASTVKTPIATQIIFWAAVIAYLIKKPRLRSFLQNEWFFLWLALFYTVYFNFFYNAQTGIRYYLVIYPLLYIFAGSLFTEWARFTSTQKALAGILGVYLAASTLSYYPNYLAYFNEIVWDRKMAYKYLADSNIDWRQDYNTLKEYRATHVIEKAPDIPYLLDETTTFFISVNDLTGVTTSPPSTYAWLRENFEPTGMIAPSYLLFEIKPEQMQNFCNRTDYCQ